MIDLLMIKIKGTPTQGAKNSYFYTESHFVPIHKMFSVLVNIWLIFFRWPYSLHHVNIFLWAIVGNQWSVERGQLNTVTMTLSMTMSVTVTTRPSNCFLAIPRTGCGWVCFFWRKKNVSMQFINTEDCQSGHCITKEFINIYVQPDRNIFFYFTMIYIYKFQRIFMQCKTILRYG